MSRDEPHTEDALAHYITIRAVVPLTCTDPASWDLGALLAHLGDYPEQVQEVLSVRLVPELAEPLTRWRHPDTGLTEDDESRPF